MRDGKGLRIIISILLVVSIFSPPMSGALTTFGKTNPQNQNQNTPAPSISTGNARQCKMENDCAGIQNTSCVADPIDGRTRCLCSDNKAPVNGVCTNKFKALHRTCNDDIECIQNAQCVQRNVTFGKRCYCKEGFYQESLMLCSGCSSIFTMYTMALLATSLVVGRLNYI